MIDFDEIRVWAPKLSRALSGCVGKSIASKISRANPEYVDDSLELLYCFCGRDRVIEACLHWLQANTIAGYHGTRLTDEEVKSVRQLGLLPLDAMTRRERIERALSPHPGYSSVRERLDDTLMNYGPSARVGSREGRVHLTLSRAGLVHGFNHYLTHGSEFDQHVACDLLGEEGKDMLSKDGQARVIQFQCLDWRL